MNKWGYVRLSGDYTGPRHANSGSRERAFMECVRAAHGEFVPSSDIAAAIGWDWTPYASRKLADIAMNIRRKYGPDRLISQQGHGYAWRDLA